MHDMLDFFAVAEGPYGRVEVVVVHTHLTTHSHPYTHFTFWLGGGKVESRVGTQQVQLGTHQALGINSHVSHDMRLLDVDEKAFVLNLYINDEWLDAQFCETSKPMVLNRPGIDITPAVQAACFQLLGDLSSPMLGRVNTNSEHGYCVGQFRAWKLRPHNSPPLSTACPSSVATSA